MLIKDAMTVRTIRIHHDSNLYHAAEIVALSSVSDLMVVDYESNFIGVLSEGDILRSALPDIDEILSEGGTLDVAYQIFLEKGKRLSNLPIMPLVIQDPIVVDPDDHIAKATTVLVEKMIRRLPVVKDEKLVGTISRQDVCRAVIGTL